MKIYAYRIHQNRTNKRSEDRSNVKFRLLTCLPYLPSLTPHIPLCVCVCVCVEYNIMTI